MNSRRSFLSQMLTASVACMALPSAITYSRIWRPNPKVWYLAAKMDLAYEEAAMWEFRYIFDPRAFQTLQWPNGLGYDIKPMNYEETPTVKWRVEYGYT